MLRGIKTRLHLPPLTGEVIYGFGVKSVVLKKLNFFHCQNKNSTYICRPNKGEVFLKVLECFGVIIGEEMEAKKNLKKGL